MTKQQKNEQKKAGGVSDGKQQVRSSRIGRTGRDERAYQHRRRKDRIYFALGIGSPDPNTGVGVSPARVQLRLVSRHKRCNAKYSSFINFCPMQSRKQECKN